MVYIIGLLTLLILGLAVLVLSRLPKALGSAESTATDDAPVANNKLNGLLWMLFLVFGTIGTVWTYLDAKNYFLPVAASEHGRDTDSQFWFDMVLVMIAFFIVNFLLFYFSWKYQYNKNRRAKFYPENHKLELIWTAIPAIIMAVLVILGYKSWSNIMEPANLSDKNLQIVEILGKQFNWYIRYGGNDQMVGDHDYNYKLINANNEMGIDYTKETSFDDFMPQEMHLVVGKPVLLKIRARDVLHSVFIPHMRVKMDAVPGMPTHFKFLPEKTTEDMREITGNGKFDYEIACTEVCGRGHFSMRLKLVVESQAEYDRWKAQQKPLLATILENDPGFLTKIPENIRAKAMKYAPAPAVADSTTVDAGSAVATSASLR
jgi:cytochrome c oxidase subunit II